MLVAVIRIEMQVSGAYVPTHMPPGQPLDYQSAWTRITPRRVASSLSTDPQVVYVRYPADSRHSLGYQDYRGADYSVRIRRLD